MAGVGTLALGGPLGALAAGDTAGTRDYRGPNFVIIRFGGGVRRLETIDPTAQTYAPFFYHKLTKRGTFFPRMELSCDSCNTSHGEGTLYILTGKYEKFKGIGAKMGDTKIFDGRFEAGVPTLFEYFRKEFNVPAHQTLIVNGEDRGDEEFYNFSNHHLFGAQFRSNTLSLRRFKTYLLRRQIAEGKFKAQELPQQQKDLAKMEALDYRHIERAGQGAELDGFWQRWREYYGEKGFVNERGDRLLTELTVRAMRELRPKMIMVNYNDPDYVHWGYLSHYTRGISIIDEGIERLVTAVENDPAYRDNTIFVIVPDCGRDSNPYAAVPCQHHFNSKSSHEIFALFLGPGIAKGVVVDRTVDQIQVAATVGKLAGMPTAKTEGPVLEEVFA